jgi:hypothetical protein
LQVHERFFSSCLVLLLRRCFRNEANIIKFIARVKITVIFIKSSNLTNTVVKHASNSGTDNNLDSRVASKPVTHTHTQSAFVFLFFPLFSLYETRHPQQNTIHFSKIGSAFIYLTLFDNSSTIRTQSIDTTIFHAYNIYRYLFKFKKIQLTKILKKIISEKELKQK